MSGKMTRPGGETSDDSKRSFGGAANSNRSQQADAQPTARVAKVAVPSTSAPADAQVNGGGKVTASTAYVTGSRDFGGDGVPLGGTYKKPAK